MSSAGRLSPLVVFALVVVAVLAASASEALAQAVAYQPAPEAVPHAAPQPHDVASMAWHLVTQPRVLIALIGLVIGLVAGDDESWLWLFGIVIVGVVAAVFLFEAGLTVMERPGMGTAAVATVVIAVIAALLLVLKLTRPLFFAATELAFSLAAIYFSVRTLDGRGGSWAALVLSVYGVVDGLDRIIAAIGQWGKDAPAKA